MSSLTRRAGLTMPSFCKDLCPTVEQNPFLNTAYYTLGAPACFPPYNSSCTPPQACLLFRPGVAHHPDPRIFFPSTRLSSPPFFGRHGSPSRSVDSYILSSTPPFVFRHIRMSPQLSSPFSAPDAPFCSPAHLPKPCGFSPIRLRLSERIYVLLVYLPRYKAR